MLSGNLRTRKRHVFVSIFDTTHNKSPTETWHSNSSRVGSSNIDTDLDNRRSEWKASWQIVTQTLGFPKKFEYRDPLEPKERIDTEFINALKVIISPREISVPDEGNGDIVAWLSSQVRHHYFNYVLPIILQPKDCQSPELELLHRVEIIEGARKNYEHRLSFIKEQMDNISPEKSIESVSNFRRDLSAFISNTVTEIFSVLLKEVLGKYIALVLKMPTQNDHQRASIQNDSLDADKANCALLNLLKSLKNVGLAGNEFQVIFAEVMSNAMSSFIRELCQNTLSLKPPPTVGNPYSREISPKIYGLASQKHLSQNSHCVQYIFEWIENKYAKLVSQVLSLVDEKTTISCSEIEKVKEIAISRLAEVRTKQLFDIVENWPHNREALDDLRTVITTPERRLRLTEVFARDLSTRILHPAASTTKILQTYISMIWSFHSLDHSKVLLDKVAYTLLSYLCTREDTVRIIITSLLADTDENQSTSTGEKLTELAWLLDNQSKYTSQRVNDENLDWHDMDWIPDPVDAGPGYRRSKNADIIGTLIGVLGSREIFIKEFQKIIGDSFLRYDGVFSKEIKVLELLKVQFGEAPLQACEVMLKDIQDSQKLDYIIRKIQNLKPDRPETQQTEKYHQKLQKINLENSSDPSLHAKILSRFFWPELHTESYRIPDEILEQKNKYEEGFESLKSFRKLTWLDTLGHATVKLELKDRTIVEEVHTWQAAVIWAFQSDGSNEKSPQLTVSDISKYLEMKEALVRSALWFWVKKSVLNELPNDTYNVRETLNSQETGGLETQSMSSKSTKNLDGTRSHSSHDINNGSMKEKMEIYWHFIFGMLTNSSRQMPLQQIAMMLKTLIIDGFPHSNEELKEFLQLKIAEGALEMTGGKYRLKK
ncbi:Anaphase-promoting complex subunit 2 [Golovinomyces cichoracearum]|uniref:Anaphase-promoting complex subunit 2 n=1 Tax=Golovinomyces cichoracearum TaxID=62708 RepID=A0A420I607_9PEZI|nr:Anaphase-promoting complex subunit 2 [Golovinomyces cichoracearum]